MKKFLILMSSIYLLGCQAMMYGTGTDFNRISVGMTTAQVVSILGAPSSIGADTLEGTEKLYYKKMGKTLDWAPTSYVVIFKNGKVIKYGESGD